MTDKFRALKFSEGVTVSAPDTTFQGMATFANDAAYETAKGSAGVEGDVYFNTTIQVIRLYKNSAWENITAEEIDYDNTTSGMAATTTQDAIDENRDGIDINATAITNKQDNVITTRGDIIRGDASGNPERLALGSAGFVLKSDGNDAVWAAESGGGSGGSGQGVFNYLTNPFAELNAIDGVTTSATTGSWTVGRTLDPAELPNSNENIPTAYTIAATGLTAGDYVDFGSVDVVSAADGGITGVTEVRINDYNASINGEVYFQLYDNTNLVYVGSQINPTSSGTFSTDAPLITGDNFSLRCVAVGATVTEFGSTMSLIAGNEKSGPTQNFPNGAAYFDTGSGVGTGHGSSATKIRNFTNVTVVGDAFTATSDNTNGAQVTALRDCIVSYSYSDTNTLSSATMGVSINGSTTTDIFSLAPYTGTSGRLAPNATSIVNAYSTLSGTVKLSAGDILRPHTDGSQNSVANRAQFSVVETWNFG